MICVIQHLALTVSDVCSKLGCFQSTSTYSALDVTHFINSRLPYYKPDVNESETYGAVS